jgi:hypothetical protein
MFGNDQRARRFAASYLTQKGFDRMKVSQMQSISLYWPKAGKLVSRLAGYGHSTAVNLVLFIDRLEHLCYLSNQHIRSNPNSWIISHHGKIA